MTNFEKITKSPEELAKFLDEIMIDCARCPVKCNSLEADCKENWQKWLNREEMESEAGNEVG